MELRRFVTKKSNILLYNRRSNIFPYTGRSEIGQEFARDFYELEQNLFFYIPVEKPHFLNLIWK